MLGIKLIKQLVNKIPQAALFFQYSCTTLRAGLRVALAVIYQQQARREEIDRSQPQRLAVAELVAHVFFEHDGEQQSGKFVGLQVGEIDAEMKAGIDVERLDVAVGGPAAHSDDSVIGQQILMMEVEFAPGDMLPRCIEVEAGVVRLWLHERLRIDGVIESHCIRVDAGITNIDLAKKDIVRALLEHAEDAARDAEVGIIA